LHLRGADVSDLAFTSDGRTLVSANRKEEIEFWNVHTGRRMLVLSHVIPQFAGGKAIKDRIEVEWQTGKNTRLRGGLSVPPLAALDAELRAGIDAER